MTDVVSISQLSGGAGEISPSGDVGTPGASRWVALSDLVVDLRYQRAVDRAGWRNIRTICDNFSWPKFEPLIVAPSIDWPGRFNIIDGQHRAIAAFLHPQITEVPTIVHDLDLQQQAQAFRDVNRNITRITPLAIYRSGLMAGDPKAIAIKTVVDAAGVKIAKYNMSLPLMNPDECLCLSTIEKMLTRHGFEATKTALTSLRKVGEQAAAGTLISRNALLVSVIAPKTLNENQLLDVLLENDVETLRDTFLPRVQNPAHWPGVAAAWLVSKAEAQQTSEVRHA